MVDGMRAVQVSEFGGPEVLQVVEIPDPVPSGDLLLVDVIRAGVNYADTHQAENTYLSSKQPPFIPGTEVCGTTSDGRRVVAFLDGGGYAEKALVHPALTFDLPDSVADDAALALAVQGSTAWLMLHDVARVALGDWVVIFAAAGGVGTLAIQLAKAAGAHVVACASTAEKRSLAASLGADATIDSGVDDLEGAIRAATGGHGADVVLEMTGGRTTDQAMEALAPFGRLVFYGMASRQPPSNLSPLRLMSRSTAVMGFWLIHAFMRPARFRAAMTDLIDSVAAGGLRPIVGGTYGLSEVQQAHIDLRARRTTGKTVLDTAR
jgi:NADPH2:quinone reductase